MNYFESKQYREDYTNILKALLLLTKKMEEITEELRLSRTQMLSAHTNNQSADDSD